MEFSEVLELSEKTNVPEMVDGLGIDFDRFSNILWLALGKHGVDTSVVAGVVALAATIGYLYAKTVEKDPIN